MQVANTANGGGRYVTNRKRKSDAAQSINNIFDPQSQRAGTPFLAPNGVTAAQNGQDLDQAVEAAQRGEAVRPSSWAEYETGVQDWTGEVDRFVVQSVKDSEGREGVWQESAAFKDYQKQQSASITHLLRQSAQYRDFFNSHRDVYGDKHVDGILSALETDTKRLNAVASILNEEGKFRSQFLDQDEFDTYQRLSKADQDELKRWNGELGGHLDDLDQRMGGYARQVSYDLQNTAGMGVEETLAYFEGQKLKDEYDRTRQTQNRVLNRYYQLDNEQKLAALEQDREALGLYQTAGLGTTSRADRKKAIKALSDMGYDYNRLSQYQQTREDAKRYRAQQEEIAEEARAHPWISTGVSILASPFQGLNYIDQAIRALTNGSPDDIENYVPLNPYNMGATNYVSGVQGTLAEDLEKKYPNAQLFGVNVPSFAYQTGTSILNSGYQVALMGPASVIAMGGAAAAGEMQDIIARGGNNRQALMGGTAAGIAEMLFEKVSVDRLLEPKSIDGWKTLVKETAKQAGVEASEETFTEIANILSDAAIMGRDSRSAIAQRNYMLDGKSQAEAKTQVFLDNIGEVALAGIGGALSGGIIGLVSGASNMGQNRSTGGYLSGLGDDVVLDVINEGLDSPEGTRGYELAKRIQNKLNAGKTPGSAEIGALYQSNIEQIEAERAAETTLYTDGPFEREAAQPGIRPTWDTDAILRQAAMEMQQDAQSGTQTTQRTEQDSPPPFVSPSESGAQDGLQQQTLPAPLVQLAQEMALEGRAQQALPAPLVQLAQEMALEGGTQQQTLPAPLVQLAQEMALEGGTQQQTLPAPLVQLAQEMADISLLEQTAIERLQLVQAQVTETFGPGARALGMEGQIALLEGWNGQQSTQDYFDSFAAYYRAGLAMGSMNWVPVRYIWALTEQQKQAAYHAGEQDAVELIANEGIDAGRGWTKLSDGPMPTPMPPVADRATTSLTGQQDRATISTTEDGSAVFSNEIDELQGRQIQYGDKQEFERDNGRITARRIKNFSENNLFVQEGVKLSRTELRRINKLISTAKDLMEIAGDCNIPIVISQNRGSIAAYNPRTDVIFVDSRFGKARIPWELQADYACPNHPLSTVVHEMYHWKDAYEYRKSGGIIKDAKTLKDYTDKQREICREMLLDFGVDLDDVARMGREVSSYAREALTKNNYEEVLAEYRTYLLLKGGR